jgi:lipoprotein NlpD
MLEMRNWRSMVAYAVAASVLAACASKGPRTPAPVEDRSSGARAPVQVAPAAPIEPTRNAENANRPGYYTVRPGDTLIRIALDAGQNWRDIARWNDLENPNRIEVGQVLRVTPPVSATEVARNSANTQAAQRAPAAVPPASAAASAAAAVPPASSPSTNVASVPPAVAGLPSASGEDELPWGWPTPAPGGVLAPFDEQKNKGLDIGGKAGEPVLAAADGRVVYAGAGLRGYGNLIILKHNNTYLSAYAHNQTLLVKEDQAVRKGQKIAEMGSSDADRVKLHFEIRRQGKPVDPARYLPMR